MNIRLKIALIEAGVRQLDLSRFLEIDPGKVSKIVNEWIEPDAETKERISRYLDKPIDELFPNDVEVGGVHARSR